MTQASAAERFGDRRTSPAHLGHRLPERAIVRLRPLEDAPRYAGGTAFGQEPSGLVAQLLEFVREVEIHAGRPARNVSTARLNAAGWCRLAACPASSITTFAAPGILRAM